MIKTIYEDDYLEIVNKPAGVISADISPLICHRLDRDTSGLLILAKSPQTKRKIQSLFKKRKIKKEYLAVVSGKIIPEGGRIEGYIVRHQKDQFKRRFLPVLDFAVPQSHKKKAVSLYRVKRYYRKELFKNPSQKGLNYMTQLLVKIITGRTHQIRVQFAYLHHPVIGDELYGGKLMKKIDEKLNIKRQFLHAWKIEFIHPITGKKLILMSPLPNDLTGTLNILQKEN